jgi:hypothetical protein
MRASHLAVLVIACGLAEHDVGIPLRHLPLTDSRIVDPNPGTGETTLQAQRPPVLQLTAVNGTILVTDPQGRRLGQVAPGQPILREIPDGIFYEHEEPDDHEAALMTDPQVARAVLLGAAAGTYRVTVLATGTGNAVLEISAQQQDRSQHRSKLSFLVTEGDEYLFDMVYDPVATSAPTITALFPTWAPNVEYSIGDQVSFEGLDYQCRQAHTSQLGWEPPNVYALWARINAGATWAPQVLYQTGDEVVYQAIRYRALQGHQSQPGWEPPNVPALWTVVN